MKKILLQYLYLFVITLILICVYISVNACEAEKIQEETLPICEELQVSTVEKPCKQEEGNINTVIKAIEKLGESGTLPK